jgi:hypothetical protein
MVRRHMKTIAFYLPQFHRVKENDLWYGEGFTDWKTCKNAVPMFDGHYQPHIPLHENYYDLLDVRTLEQQADMMKTYGVDGVSIYHYWFGNDKQILEKPAEILLEHKEIDMPFCFYWANQSWINSWSAVRGNAWTETVGEFDDVLLGQKYGREEEWKKHFDYMLPFFEDERYISIDGRPVVLILETRNIPCYPMMRDYWDELARKCGFNGIYIIGSDAEQLDVDGILIREPNYSRKKLKKVKGKAQEGLKLFSYEDAEQLTLSSRIKASKPVYYSTFCNFDSTERHGRRGTVFYDFTPELFRENLKYTYLKNEAEGVELTFINAWNEWGEGMHLEPDEKYGYAYLEAVVEAKKEYEILKEKAGIFFNEYTEEYSNNDTLSRIKYERYLNRLDDWMRLRESDKNMETWLLNNKLQNVLVYGYGIFGKHMLNELSNSHINVMGLIDKDVKNRDIGYPCFALTDEFPKADCIIVTSFFFLTEIYKDIKSLHPEMKIISVEEIIDDMI